MSKVALKGFILVPEKDLELVKHELITHKRLTLEEPGCLTFLVTQSPTNPFRFDVYEEFVDKASFRQHQERVQASHWEK
ncbi:putative quinol monooxygenase [Vibrio diabolicus]|uniref:putative quinol monooxygenase n=1 Tax=Vibrio diabolicus TaxID=50719 RepID=UPI003750FF80